MTEIRYRRRNRARWHTGTLRAATRLSPGELQAVLTDSRSGNTRTLTTTRWQIEVSHHDRWVPLRHWAYATPELFTIR
jgi:hypothetical protein